MAERALEVFMQICSGTENLHKTKFISDYLRVMNSLCKFAVALKICIKLSL